MNDINIIKEVDGLQESIYWLNKFEKKYGITSKEFYDNNYDTTIDEEDACFWEFYIECYLECGGSFDCMNDDYECNELNERVKETIFTTSNNDLIVKGNIEKGRDFVKSLPFSILVYKLFYVF